MGVKDDFAVRGFRELVETVEDGDLDRDLDYELRTLIKAMRAVIDRGMTKKTKGSLTLKVNLELTASGDVLITPDITAKPPKAPRSDHRLFSDAAGGLSRWDNKQADFTIPGTAEAVRDAPRLAAVED